MQVALPAVFPVRRRRRCCVRSRACEPRRRRVALVGPAGRAAAGNPCAVNNGGCAAGVACKEGPQPGAWQCGDSCPPGFTGSPATGCVDVNECAVSNGGCHKLSACRNTNGVAHLQLLPAGLRRRRLRRLLRRERMPGRRLQRPNSAGRRDGHAPDGDDVGRRDGQRRRPKPARPRRSPRRPRTRSTAHGRPTACRAPARRSRSARRR